MLSPFPLTGSKVCHRLRLSTPTPCPPMPVSSHLRGNQAGLHRFLKPSKTRGPSLRKSYVAFPITANTASSASLVDSLQFPFPGYMKDLGHSRIAPACLPDSPLFTLPTSHRLPPTHTPESGSGALAYSFPDPIGHHEIFIRLALSSFRTSIGFLWVGSSDAAMFASCCGPRPCSAPVPTWTLPPNGGKAQRAFYVRAFLGLVTSS